MDPSSSLPSSGSELVRTRGARCLPHSFSSLVVHKAQWMSILNHPAAFLFNLRHVCFPSPNSINQPFEKAIIAGSWPVSHGFSMGFPWDFPPIQSPGGRPVAGLTLDGSIGWMGTTMDVGRSQVLTMLNQRQIVVPTVLKIKQDKQWLVRYTVNGINENIYSIYYIIYIYIYHIYIYTHTCSIRGWNPAYFSRNGRSASLQVLQVAPAAKDLGSGGIGCRIAWVAWWLGICKHDHEMKHTLW